MKKFVLGFNGQAASEAFQASSHWRYRFCRRKRISWRRKNNAKSKLVAARNEDLKVRATEGCN
jgi:hypothetical protein